MSEGLLTWVQVDLKALANNYRQLRQLASRNMAHSLGIMPVIKADAYGHGLLQVARCLSAEGCAYFGVSNIAEGRTLREAGFKQTILVFESTLPDCAQQIIDYGLVPTVCTRLLAKAINECARRKNKTVGVHVKVDTGMGRLGVEEKEAGDFVRQLVKDFPFLKLEGIYTHFPLADTDRDFTLAQMRRFRDIVLALQNKGITVPFIHAGNSMGMGDYKSEIFNIARPGLMLYGLYPSVRLVDQVKLKPVMSVHSRVIFVKRIAKNQGVSYGHTFKAPKDMAIAVLPIGYSNGYLRSLSNKAAVLIEGVKCPVLGRVTMDQIMVDITALHVQDIDSLLGRKAVILGHQKSQHVTADDLALWAGTINYEMICALGNLLPRVYPVDRQAVTSDDREEKNQLFELGKYSRQGYQKK